MQETKLKSLVLQLFILFSSSVAEEFGATTKFPTPVVESTGTGGGMKLFCAGAGLDTPDITNASRRMKDKELKCVKKMV